VWKEAFEVDVVNGLGLARPWPWGCLACVTFIVLWLAALQLKPHHWSRAAAERFHELLPMRIALHTRLFMPFNISP
jgi:hypothetical protein